MTATSEVGESMGEMADWRQRVDWSPAALPYAERVRGGVHSTEHPAPFWAPAPVHLGLEMEPEVLYPSVEHCYQAHKVVSFEDLLWVVSARDGEEARFRGEQVPLVSGWALRRYDAMLLALRVKYRDHALAARALRATGDRPIVADMAGEWGCLDAGGGHGGPNLLGRALMRVRSELLHRPV